jgi:hypothetical protein
MTVTKQQCKTFETPKTVTESKEECVDVTTDVCIKVPVPNCVTEHEKVVSEVTALYHYTQHVVFAVKRYFFVRFLSPRS